MRAPDFTLMDQAGNPRSLSEYTGQWVVFYAYPKDDTPGCTKEACAFRDASHKYAEAGVVVLGISKDSVASHAKFAKKHNLQFPLLSDPEAGTLQAYGAWGEKKFMGKTFTGILRHTFLINPQGELVKTYVDVDVLTHAGAILKDIREFTA